ncbi:hypothetical protein QFZ96_000933 [Paraburkholderia youngii]
MLDALAANRVKGARVNLASIDQQDLLRPAGC